MTIFFIAPHLSTGGMPQYLYKQIEALYKEHTVYCLEWDDVTGGQLVIQRNRIKNILGNKLITLDQDKHHLFKLIEKHNPDVIHLQEIPEMFMPSDIADKFYSINRTYKIVETSHDSSFNISKKIYFPDKFMMVSQYQVETYKPLNIPIELVEYPIEYKTRTHTREELMNKLGLDPNKKHIINVGLFTPRKNQAEVIEYARMLKDYPIQFHFIGNQADNFQHYWQPLMKDFPSNCKWWGERDDVDTFFEMADLFLFTSRGNATDKETMPLVIREAISWKTPSLIFNLDVYLDYFNKFSNIEYLDFSNKHNNIKSIIEKLNINKMTSINVWYDKSDNKIFFKSLIEEYKNITISIKDLDSNSVIWATKYESLYPGIEYWIIPTPKSYIDFETNPFIGGLKIDFYQNDKVIFSKDIKIKQIFIQKPKLSIKNYTEPTYINYIEFFVDKIYDKYLSMKDFDVVVDVGANIGLWIEYIRNISNPKKIYAIEPNKKALEILKESFSDSSIEIVDKALSDKDGEIEFFIDEENSTISSSVKYDSLKSSYKVDCINFKTFIKSYNIEKIDLLKVDIETGEYPLFESLQKDDFEKIENILVEYHLIAGRTYDDVEKLKAILTNFGYNIKVRDMHSIGGFIFASKVPSEESIGNVELKQFLDKNPAPNKRDLASLINKMFPEGKGVEIGVLRGEYSKIILERWHKGTLYLIDAWRHLDDYIDMNGQHDEYHYDCLIETCKNIKPWQDRAHILRMDSSLSANMFPDEYFDFIYIDADHSYEGVVKDLEAWWPKIKKGGLFCGDDYIPDNGDIWLTGQGEPVYAGKFGVRKAVNEFIAKKDLVLYETTEEPYWRQWYTFKPI